MPKKIEKKAVKTTLLKSLLNCFSSSRSMIRYVTEKEVNRRKVYELALNNVTEWWRLLFSNSIAALSVAPRSHGGELSKDALSAFVRCIVNDKNKSIIEENLVPHFQGPRCYDLISEEVLHLEQTIDIGVRAAHSAWNKYSDTLPCEKLCGSAEVRIYYEDAVRFLMELFRETPYKILLDRYSWFAECISTSAPEIERYTTNQILSIFACALILCLNITEVPEVNANIETYIRAVIPQLEDDGDADEGTAPQKEISGNELRQGEAPQAEEDPAFSSIEKTILKAALKINLYETQQGRKPLDESAELIIKQIIDAIMRDLYDDILSVSAQLWSQFDTEQKAQSILKAYVYELSSIRDLSFKL